MAFSSLLSCLLVVFACLIVCEAQYEDVRCKCVCPKVSNSTNNIFVTSFNEPSECKCEKVIDKNLQKDKFCDRCECKWQRRNTTTIKVVVIFIICIVALLFLYMLFLLCLDPLMSRRPKYLEHQNEEVNLGDDPDFLSDAARLTSRDTQSVQRMVDDSGARNRAGVMSRVRQEVSKVRGEQQKWKGQVQEQRRNIYDKHTMLN